MIRIAIMMLIRTEGTSMSLIQVQQLSRHPTDYGAEILVQVMSSIDDDFRGFYDNDFYDDFSDTDFSDDIGRACLYHKLRNRDNILLIRFLI